MKYRIRITLAVFAALVLLAQMGFAGTPLNPPERFDHPYYGTMTIVSVDSDNVAVQCSAPGEMARADTAGCAIMGHGQCKVYLAIRTRRAPIAAIFRHERAHCNGWAADHSN